MAALGLTQGLKVGQICGVVHTAKLITQSFGMAAPGLTQGLKVGQICGLGDKKKLITQGLEWPHLS
jgi:hypothetical protein